MARGDDAGSVERSVDRLYGLPLEEFTPARNALARELKKAGDDAAAARVMKLAKPTRSAGALNRAVRGNRREARRLLSAADKLSEAQEQLLRKGSRAPVERAVEGERAAVDRLMTAVEKELGRDGKSSQAMLDRARNTLHAVATTPDLREELEAGRVTKDHKAVGFGDLTVPAGRSSAGPSRPAKKKDDARRRVKRAEQDVEAAERALRRVEGDRGEAEKRFAAANAAVGQCEKDLAEAVGARDAARQDLERA
jgi:chromosome segregation ATPase